MEQRPQVRQDALNRVCSAIAQLVSLFVVRNLNKHACFLRKTSGQLPNLGLLRCSVYLGALAAFMGGGGALDAPPAPAPPPPPI
jgi:hypothetical protein